MPPRAPIGLAITALPIVLVLSACVGGAGEPAQAPGQTLAAGPAEFDETTGAVEGIVTDTSLTPLAGVQIGLLPGTNSTAQSDAQGVFTISHVAPGDYQFVAQALGFQPFSRAIQVKAGEKTTVEAQLSELPVVEPYHTVKIQRGLFGCGFTVRPVVGVSVCGVFSLLLNQTQYDKFLLEWKLDGKPSEWKTGLVEMQWQSTQAAGRALSVIWEVDDCPNVREQRLGRATGPSPLRVQINDTQITDLLANATADKECDEASGRCDDTEKCETMTRVFPAAELLGPASPADVGFTFQQSFTQYETEFFVEPAPPDHSSMPDA